MASRNTAILSIRIVANSARATAGLKKTQRNVRAVQADLNRLRQTGFTRLVGTLGKVAAMGTLVAGAAAVAGAAMGALAAGAVAASVAIGPALIAIMLGFEGIKNAAKKIQPQFDALKSAISGVFERELAPGMELLGGLMDKLTGSMTSLASTISTEFNSMMGLLDQSAGKLDLLIQGSGAFVTGFGFGMRDLVQGLIDFGAAAGPSMETFGKAIGGVLGVVGEVLSKFAEMGKVPALMDGISAAFDGFADLFGSVLTVVMDLVSAIGPEVGEAFSAIGDALEEISPHLAEFGKEFADTLVEAIKALLPSLPLLLDGFERVLDVLEILLPVIGPLAAFIADNIDAFLILASALKIVTLVMAAFNFVLALNPITLIVLAVIILITIIYQLATRTQFFQTIWEFVCNAVVTAWNWTVELIKTVWNAVVEWFKGAVEWLKAAWEGFTGFLSASWEFIKSAAQATWDWICSIVQGAIDIAKGIIDGFKAAVDTVWNGIKDVASAVWDTIKGIIQGAIDFATGVVDGFKNAGSRAFDAVKGAVDGVKSAIDWLVGAVKNVIDWLGRISFPSAPSWMSSLMGGFGAAEFTFQPATITRFLPETYQAFGAASPELTAASVFAPIGGAALKGGGGNTSITNVNITVEGAVDPVGTANQIRKILNDTDQRVGVGVTARWG